jgi:type II secretory pathway component GspD/PulD (secretin)
MHRHLPALAAALALLAAPGATAAQVVTVAFTDAPLREVVATLAHAGGVGIVLSPGTEARVNAELRAEPWRAALEAIAGAHGLVVRDVGPGLLRVDRAGGAPAEAGGPLVTRLFRLSHLPAVDAGRILEGIRSPRGTVAVSEHANAVVLTDTAERVSTAARILGHAP